MVLIYESLEGKLIFAYNNSFHKYLLYLLSGTILHQKALFVIVFYNVIQKTFFCHSEAPNLVRKAEIKSFGMTSTLNID